MQTLNKTNPVKDGMTVVQLNLSFSDAKCYEQVEKYFKEKLIKDGNLGQGVLSYIGRRNDDGTIFLGSNNKLGTNVLSFFDKKGMTEFELFRKDFLNLKDNVELSQKFTVSNLKASYVMIPPPEVRSPSQLSAMFEDTVQIQQKSVPKVSIDTGDLFVGGKTGSVFVQTSGVVNATLSVTRMVVSIKIKDKGGYSCMQYILNSIETDIYTIVAFLMWKQFTRIKLSKLLEYIIRNVVKNFDVGKVSNFSQEKERATTSSGKYVIRSLAGIKNKLLKELSSIETQVLFTSWFDAVYNELYFKIPEADRFFNDLTRILREPPTGKKKPKRPSTQPNTEAVQVPEANQKKSR